MNRQVAPGVKLLTAKLPQSILKQPKVSALHCGGSILVLIDKGQEIGRIRGYPGEDYFWGLLGMLIKKLDAVRTGGDRARHFERSLRATG